MLAKYPATYADANGTVETIITNDGAKLSMQLRGVTFEAGSPEHFEAQAGTDPDRLRMFNFTRKHLSHFRLHWVMDVLVADGEREVTAPLACEFETSVPNEGERNNTESLKLILKVAGQEFESSESSRLFENGLLEIQARLPSPMFLRACINCQFSDYCVYAQCVFGTMMCFRNVKEDYVKVRGKHEFLDVQDRYERFVQETYVCEQFERRIPGTGFRG